MGIFIYLAVSESVTKEEWENVYRETLRLAQNLPLAERRKIRIHGIDTVCLAPVEEHEENYGLFEESNRLGWFADGDSTYMRTAECYYLPKDLVKENEVNPDAGDAMLGALPDYLPYRWDDERFHNIYRLWGNKTQGRPYHIYLLAVACLIEARLKEKAFIYGDITRGQCRKAVNIANQYLDEPINMPDRCYADRLWKRTSELALARSEQYKVFEKFYLGTKDAEFGKFLRENLSDEDIDIYWKKNFENVNIGTGTFDNLFREYLLWGFELEKLCNYVDFKEEEGKPKYEDFVRRVMDAKLHLKNKNCVDPLAIDQEEERPYSIWSLLSQFVGAGYRNKKVDRYIPIEEIRFALKKGIGSKCDVDGIINACLEEAESEKSGALESSQGNKTNNGADILDESDRLNQYLNMRNEERIKKREKYDIDNFEDLKFYEPGDTMPPNLMQSLGKSRNLLDSLLSEEVYINLMAGSAHRMCEWLVEQNNYFEIREKDWDKIFTDIEDNRETFGRYYPLFRMKLEDKGLQDMCIALLINDDLYTYCGELAGKQGRMEKADEKSTE